MLYQVSYIVLWGGRALQGGFDSDSVAVGGIWDRLGRSCLLESNQAGGSQCLVLGLSFHKSGCREAVRRDRPAHLYCRRLLCPDKTDLCSVEGSARVLCAQMLGKDHMDTAVSMNNLASLLFQQQKLEEALPLYQQ